MRPNIRISHTLNGRVKDYAAENDLTVPEAYEAVIEAGLAEVARGDSPAERPADATHAAAPEPDALRDGERGAAGSARLSLQEWDPTDVDNTKARDATIAAVEWLANQSEPQQKAAILEHVDSDDYAESTLWDKVLQPGLRELVDAGILGHKRNVGYWIEAAPDE